MTKHLHSGDFSGFNALVLLVLHMLVHATKKNQYAILKFVLLYVVAIVLQGGALIVFYLSVKLYVDPSSVDLTRIEPYLTILDSIIQLTNVELLLLFITPALLLLLGSSKLLRYCRVGLSDLALNLREELSLKFSKGNLLCESVNQDEFLKQIDGSFGAVRALFLNSFIFFQATVASLVLITIEPILFALNILLLLLFLYLLTTFRPTKEDKKEKLDQLINEDIMDEELGLNSKSFARLERLRVFGRNFSNISLFIFIIVGVILSLDFMVTIEKFGLTLLLIRVSMQIYTPIAVISASCVPYKKNIIKLYNMSSLLKELNIDIVSKEGKSDRLYVFISKDFPERSDLLKISYDSFALEKYFNHKNVKIITSKLNNKVPMNRKELGELREKSRRINPNDQLRFCI